MRQISVFTRLTLFVGVLTGCSGGMSLEQCVKLNLPGDSGYPRFFEITIEYTRKKYWDSLNDFAETWARCERKLEAAGVTITVKQQPK